MTPNNSERIFRPSISTSVSTQARDSLGGHTVHSSPTQPSQPRMSSSRSGRRYSGGASQPSISAGASPLPSISAGASADIYASASASASVGIDSG
eukprot:CAMPEP_0173175760 /NCGR_PEP_ID=MMETSP1141-20130122/4087_1 /TAXON_ID=483371 /ORGANISM="non described non described, Strain CCMP2298" /LENGTH=94 /DNA_ID=CAMNT_0014098031 /DNA_START=145 /DNA_END=425 /DNA_ORIENTATION=-